VKVKRSNTDANKTFTAVGHSFYIMIQKSVKLISAILSGSVGHIRKFDYVSGYMRDVLYWLPLPQRIAYRVLALVWRCLLGLYLRELICRSTQDVQARLSLRSSAQRELLVNFVRTSIRQRFALSVWPST